MQLRTLRSDGVVREHADLTRLDAPDEGWIWIDITIDAQVHEAVQIATELGLDELAVRDAVEDFDLGQVEVLDVVADPAAPPRPIHLGFQSGTDFLRVYLREIETLGINHVALNLRFNQAPIDATLEHLADTVLPDFS